MQDAGATSLCRDHHCAEKGSEMKILFKVAQRASARAVSRGHQGRAHSRDSPENKPVPRDSPQLNCRGLQVQFERHFSTRSDLKSPFRN
ncbi:unnamed protein product [Rangifer tarandus platyrhynchus]|uniref:Uncharacterized protein n=3 Tax=Rangifer tarandus platyrhynchus TaxID=3082113 RepID=A0AC59Z420_RANTA|nr:unnamed protein product [Rangifer tarandus platyrhynchus]CAI9702420.1 unnamed protein product [Rangifer tarandus platyrhynchus]